MAWSDLLAYLVPLLILICIQGIVALGLNLEVGLTGLPNFGHIGFAGIGAYTSALLTLPPPVGLGQPVWMGLPAAMGAAGLAGYLIGIPALQLRGDYLAVVTLGFGEIIRLVALNWQGLTRGPMGLPGIPQPLFAPLTGSGLTFPQYEAVFLAMAAGGLLVALAMAQRVARSPFGRALRAIREDEDAAMALGKPVMRYKLQAMVIGSALAGLGGGLYAHFLTFISPAELVLAETLLIWVVVMLGGRGNNYGVLLGAVLLLGFVEGLRFLGLPDQMVGPLRQIIFGLLLVVMIRFRPAGLLRER